VVKNDSEKRALDARERHLWLVSRRGVLGGSRFLTRGASLRRRPGWTPLQPSTQLASRSSPPHPAARASRGPVWRKRAAISHFSSQTWQRDLARPENREFAGVLERGAGLKTGNPSYETIAAALGIERRSVIRAVKAIEAAGDLTIEAHKNGDGTSFAWLSNQFNFAFTGRPLRPGRPGYDNNLDDSAEDHHTEECQPT
jgi:hypothetical protein